MQQPGVSPGSASCSWLVSSLLPSTLIKYKLIWSSSWWSCNYLPGRYWTRGSHVEQLTPFYAASSSCQGSEPKLSGELTDHWSQAHQLRIRPPSRHSAWRGRVTCKVTCHVNTSAAEAAAQNVRVIITKISIFTSWPNRICPRWCLTQSWPSAEKNGHLLSA